MKEENYHHGSGVNVNFTGARVVLLQKISATLFFDAPFFALSCPDQLVPKIDIIFFTLLLY
jgi:hypothetical protein